MFARVRVSVSTLSADVAGHLVRVGPILALDGSTGQARRDVAQPRAGSRAMHISTRAWLVRKLQFAMIKQSTIYSGNILLVSICGYRLSAAPGTGRRSCRPERAISSA